MMRILPTRLEIRRVAATWEKARVTIAGRVDGPFDQTRIDLTARGDVELAGIGGRVGSTMPLAGLVHVDGKLEGPVASPRWPPTSHSTSSRPGP